MSNEDLEFDKAKTAKAALSSYITYIIIMSQNLSKYHFSALKIKTWTFRNVIRVTVATLDRQDYINKMDYILSDQKKFTTVNLKDDTLLNFAINKEKHINKVLKKLVKPSRMTEKKQEIVKSCR